MKLKGHLYCSILPYFLKESKDGARWASIGRDFKNCGATIEKTLSLVLTGLASAGGGPLLLTLMAKQVQVGEDDRSDILVPV